MTQPLPTPVAVAAVYAPPMSAPAATIAPTRAARAWLPVLVASLGVLIAGLAVVDTLPVGVFFDDGMYVILAKSLATGHGLRWLQLPGTPAATHFPPGYPFVLSLLWRLFPQFPANVVLFKAANACFLAIAAAGVTVFARRRLAFSPWGAALFAFVTAASIPALVLSAQVMSEPLFLALLMPALLFAERVASDTEGGRRAAGDAVALGVVIGLVTLVRTNGIAVAGGLGLVLLLRRRWRDLLVVAATTIAILLPWQLWVRAQRGAIPPVMGGNYETYLTWLANGFHQMGPSLVWRTIVGTASDMGGMASVIFSPVVERHAQLAAIGVFVLLAAAGVRRLWRQAPVTAGFLGCYFTIVLLWPFTPARFVQAVWPLALVPPTLGALELWRWRAQASVARAARLAGVAGALALIAGYARYEVRGARSGWYASLARTNADLARPLIQWTRAHTAPDAVVMSNVESMIYLYGGRQALPTAHFTVRDYFRPATAQENADAMRAVLSAYHADYVAAIAAESTLGGLQLMASGPRPELRLVDSLPYGLVFAPTSR